ncbi:hypothetical protein K492DRAFT_147524 [Lichtheimia hyalospora FSU 10163]|nr:hypothetical protein K492DRAFT_147524 [Lichtheimia hyalospora FSU 10163]
MISLGGAIGTGLFLTTGENIATAGPAGALIAYAIVGLMIIKPSKIPTFRSVSGSFNHYATRFVDPAFGFAIGWNYWYPKRKLAYLFPELSAAATIIDFWKPVMPDAAWSAIFLVILVAINLVSVKLYGELEYWFAMIKILIVIVFIIIAICIAAGGLGGQVLGFKYWEDPGAFVGNGVGLVSVLLTAGFSFQGTEIVGITAGEAKNPTKTVPRAIRNTFWRIVIFYIVTIFLLGLCLPSNNPDLANTDDSAATASFTLVFELAGIEVASHVINAVTLTSVLSAGNSGIYTCSRTLLGLAHDGNAPAFFSTTNRFGAPYWAVLFSSSVGFACVFASIYSASAAFNWFLSITSVTGFISWWGIAVIHMRFRRAYKHQGRDLRDLPYKTFLYPIPSLFACVLCILIILGQGYTAFTPHFDGVLFATNYIGIVPAVVAYVAYKLIRRTRIVSLDDIDFDTGRVTHSEMAEEDEYEKNLPWFKKALNIIA